MGTEANGMTRATGQLVLPVLYKMNTVIIFAREFRPVIPRCTDTYRLMSL